MKPYIDMGWTLMGEYISNSQFCNRMLKYWGTETIDGIEVLKKKFTLYPNDNSLGYRKIVGLLGLKSKLAKADFKQLESYYLWFNPRLADDAKYSDSMLLDKLNSYISTDTVNSVLISIEDENDPMKFINYTNTELESYVKLNYATMIDKLIVAEGDTILTQGIGVYVLLDNNECLDVSFKRVGLTSVKHEGFITGDGEITPTYYSSSIALTIEFKRKATITATSKFFIAIKGEQDEAKKRYIGGLANSDSNFEMSVGLFKLFGRVSGLTNELWYRGQFRASLLRERSIKRVTLAKILGAHIDTGYSVKKKKSSWWQKVLAPVLFIAAVFFAPWTGGTSLALYWSLVAIGFTVLSLSMAAWGDTVSSGYMGRYAKISGYISAVTGIASILQNMMREIATQGIKQYVMSSISNMTSSITSAFSSAQSGTLLSDTGNYIMDNFRVVLAKSVSVGNKVASYWMELRSERQAKQLEVNGAIIKGQEEALADYTDKEYDIGAEDIKIYTKPLLVDNMQYEVDYLYEPSKYNICRPSFIVPGLNIRTDKVLK